MPPCNEQTNPKWNTHSSVIAIAGAPNNNVEIKNIKSAGCYGSLTQLQRKLFQHLDHMQLDTYILLQTIRKDHLYLLVFSLDDHQVFCFTNWNL